MLRRYTICKIRINYFRNHLRDRNLNGHAFFRNALKIETSKIEGRFMAYATVNPYTGEKVKEFPTATEKRYMQQLMQLIPRI